MARNNRRQRRQRKQTLAPVERSTSARVEPPSDTRAVRAYLRLQAWNREANATNCRRNTKHGLRSRFPIPISDKASATPKTERDNKRDTERAAQFDFYRACAKGETWQQTNN